MSLATKNVATVLVGVGLVLSMAFAFAAPAKADLLSDLQAQVQALLAQIAAMSGGSTSGGTAGAGCYTFTRTHQMGDTGGEVMWIQKFLNSHGAAVAASGAGSPGNESDYFGAKTKAAVAKWQSMNGVAPAAGFWGPLTRSKVATVCASAGPGTGIPGAPITGNGLKVMLAADSPANKSLVVNQAAGELAKFTFQNPTGSEISVTNLGFKRIGVSNDSSLSNVYLFNGATRITDSAGISSSMFNFNDSAGVFKVPAGGSVTISVRADIASGASAGEQIGVQLLSVSASSALDTTVVLPISGGTQTLSTATLGTATFTYTGPSNATDNPGTEIRVFEAQTVIGTHAAWLQSITFENRGTSDDNDLKNLKLYVDGVQVGNTVAQLSNDKATFDLSSAPKKLETGTRVLKVVADIVGGSGKTYDIQLRRAADAMIVDAELNVAIKSSSTFPIAAGTANSIGTASLSIVKKADSPTDNLAVGASNVLLARYEVRANGENVKVEALTASSTVTSAVGLDNVKVFLNGVQIGSTKDIPSGATNSVEFTFGSSFIARQGQVEILEIFADAKNAAGNNLSANDTVQAAVTVSASNTEGMDSGDAVTSGNLSASNVTGNSRTVAASTATLSKASGYGNQTMVAGTNNAKVGSFTISSGSTEGVNVNTLTIALDTAAGEAATMTDLMLKDSSTGTQIGQTKSSLSTSNSFSVNLPVPASGTKTIDVYANIKSSAPAGTWQADVSGSGTGAVTGQSVNLTSVSLQTITIGSGSLTVTRDAGTPVNSNIIAGTSQVLVGKFDFAAVNSSFTAQELMIQVPSGAATSVSGVTIKYKNSAGVEQTVSQALTLPSSTQANATATFTGLTFYVPQNDSADLDVYVDVPTVASGAVSGVGISVAVSGVQGFKAIDSSGNEATDPGSNIASNGSSGYGTKYVKKSMPTLARLSTGYTSNTVASGIGLYRFTVTADAAGAIDWREISFTINASGLALSSWTLYDVTGSAVAVNTSGAATTSATLLPICPGTSCSDGDAQQVGAGSSKTYELRAGTITGWGDSGDSLTISFTEDTSATANAAAGSLQSGQNFVWSDRSANSHSTLSTDWTNGYLVKDTDSDTRSCQYGSATTCTP